MKIDNDPDFVVLEDAINITVTELPPTFVRQPEPMTITLGSEVTRWELPGLRLAENMVSVRVHYDSRLKGLIEFNRSKLQLEIKAS